MRAVLRVISPDRPGLVAELFGLLFRVGANVLHADEHIDGELGLFFQRAEFEAEKTPSLAGELAAACERLGLRHALRFADQRRRVAILASKRGHCALDLLQRHREGELDCEIAFVCSNHAELRDEVERRGYRFVHEPIEAGDRAAQEARLSAQLAGADLVVLARYMQILSERFVDEWGERTINIHHSFLPAFPGADPYRRAHRRGVKLIGATSHYVTRELDEGPIIAQEVAPVSHRDSVADLERKGRELERRVLARAVRCHLEDRIIPFENKTVVFD